MPCRGGACHAMGSHAMEGHAMPWGGMPCRGGACHAVRGHAMPWGGMPCHGGACPCHGGACPCHGGACHAVGGHAHAVGGRGQRASVHGRQDALYFPSIFTSCFSLVSWLVGCRSFLSLCPCIAFFLLACCFVVFVEPTTVGVLHVIAISDLCSGEGGVGVTAVSRTEVSQARAGCRGML